MATTGKKIFERPRLIKKQFHYCPGCGHGVIHRLVAEVIDEMGLAERTVAMASIGCSILIYNYLDLDILECLHGRSPASATGVKRVLPDRLVFTYQGDGDLASIGAGEIVHAAHRGERISTIFVNNTTYGMTGGQMAPTTVVGQRTTTSPKGRDVATAGRPLRVAEMIATIDGAVYVARTSTHNAAEIRKTKKAIRKAFDVQMQGLGFSLVEVLATCPQNWHMHPVEALDRIQEQMVPVFPLGEFRVPEKGPPS